MTLFSGITVLIVVMAAVIYWLKLPEINYIEIINPTSVVGSGVWSFQWLFIVEACYPML